MNSLTLEPSFVLEVNEMEDANQVDELVKLYRNTNSDKAKEYIVSSIAYLTDKTVNETIQLLTL